VIYHSYQPVPALSPYVQSLHLVVGLPPPGAIREIWPDSCVELVFGFGAPLFIVADSRLCQAPPVYRVAALAGPLRLSTSGLTVIVRAQLHSWGAAPLLGAASVRATAPIYALDDVSWQLLAAAIGRALRANASDTAIAIVQQALVERIATATVSTRVLAAAQHLRFVGGQSAIRDLAAQHDISARQLERTFVALSRLGPKGLARALRFERVRDALWREERGDLTALALRYGYADQAHLAREVKSFTGQAPARLTKALRADFALLRDLDVAFIQELAASSGHTHR
jgi:AraC-like DNA-binding protein